MQTAGWRLVRVARGEDRGAWSSALVEELWADDAAGNARGAVILKQEGQDWVRRARIKVAGVDRQVVVKRRVGRGVADVVKSLAGAGRLMRQWRGAEWLLDHGIPAPRPLALARAVGVGHAAEILVMESLPGRTLLEHLALRDLPPILEQQVAESVGRLAAAIVLAGRYNRDHKPSNILITDPTACGAGRAVARQKSGGAGAAGRDVGAAAMAGIAVLDCVAIRPNVPGAGGGGAWAGGGGLERMLASLAIEPIGCQCPPTPWEMRRVVRAAAAEIVQQRGRPARLIPVLAHWLWGRAAQIIDQHGDPTPRVDPLEGLMRAPRS